MATTIYGTATNDTLIGDRDTNTIYGYEGADLLHGLGGNDWLVGGTGRDVLYGGTGNDMYILDSVSINGIFGRQQFDIVSEAAGEGIDSVLVLGIDDVATFGTDGYTLPINVEDGALAGGVVFNLFGNELDNRLFGNSAANALRGLDGNDRLDGGLGFDTLVGGAGDDTYILRDLTYSRHVGSRFDFVSELANDGIDTVMVEAISATGVPDSGSYRLGDNIENAIVTGTESGYLGPEGGYPIVFGLIGNTLNNVLTGNLTQNTLTGGGGADILRGMGGRDTLIGGGNSDRLIGGLSTDHLTGGAKRDFFIYNALNESGVKGGKWTDHITDFTNGVDKIRVTAIDAHTLLPGNQAFRLDANGSFSMGEIRQIVEGVNLRMEFNADLDAEADMAIILDNHTALLTATDFQL